jgi:hypothetical protein
MPTDRDLKGSKLAVRLGLGAARLGLGVAAITAICTLQGCESPLLTPDEDRSPFDRYDGIRNQRAAPFVEDEFGVRRPNLRGRLMPKE